MESSRLILAARWHNALALAGRSVRARRRRRALAQLVHSPAERPAAGKRLRCALGSLPTLLPALARRPAAGFSLVPNRCWLASSSLQQNFEVRLRQLLQLGDGD